MRYFNRLTFKFTAGVFVIVACFAAVLGVVSYEYEKQAIKNRLYSQLNAIADLKKGTVVGYLNERENDLNALVSAHFLRRQVVVLLGRSPGDPRKRPAFDYLLQRLRSFKETYLGYDYLEIVDLNGGILVSSESGAFGSPGTFQHDHRATLRYHADALRRGSTVIFEEGSGDHHLDFIRGIPDMDGMIRAAVVTSIDLRETIFPLFSDYTGLGRTGETLILRGTEGRISYVNPTRYELRPDAVPAKYGERYLGLSKYASSGNEGIDDGIDYRGRAVIGAYRYIPSLGWGIVAKMDVDEAYAEIHDLRRKSLFLSLGILTVMVVIVYIVVQRFTTPVTELIRKTQAITSGQYSVLERSGRKDEIGELEDNFNEMVAALDAARFLAGIKQEELEKKVTERTENLARVNDDLSRALEALKRESSAKKALEEQLLHSQKMEAVGTLAGGIAHDFNNILTGIIGYGNMMRMKMGDDKVLREYLDHILAASDRAASLTHSLLAFSRRQIISPRPMDINRVIGRVEMLLARLIGEDIQLRISLHAAPVVVMADPGQMEQVLLNFATNARDAMPAGGVFSITTSIEEITQHQASLQGLGSAGRYAVIAAGDTGSGMDDATRVRIFDPFFTTKEVGKGTGLGLSIVYGIIEQQNGAITCSSEPGKGTMFRIFLPLTDAAAEQEEAPAAHPPQRGRETVLVAEDNQEVRRLTRDVLTEFGYTVLEAFDGDDAIRKYREHRDAVDLLLFDVIMPRKNGKDAYEEIRKDRPDIKVIFISGYTADVIRQQGYLDGQAVVLAKPIAPRELIRKVREVIDKAPAREQ